MRNVARRCHSRGCGAIPRQANMATRQMQAVAPSKLSVGLPPRDQVGSGFTQTRPKKRGSANRAPRNVLNVYASQKHVAFAEFCATCHARRASLGDANPFGLCLFGTRRMYARDTCLLRAAPLVTSRDLRPRARPCPEACDFEGVRPKSRRDAKCDGQQRRRARTKLGDPRSLRKDMRPSP